MFLEQSKPWHVTWVMFYSTLLYKNIIIHQPPQKKKHSGHNSAKPQSHHFSKVFLCRECCLMKVTNQEKRNITIVLLPSQVSKPVLLLLLNMIFTSKNIIFIVLKKPGIWKKNFCFWRELSKEKESYIYTWWCWYYPNTTQINPSSSCL